MAYAHQRVEEFNVTHGEGKKASLWADRFNRFIFKENGEHQKGIYQKDGLTLLCINTGMYVVDFRCGDDGEPKELVVSKIVKVDMATKKTVIRDFYRLDLATSEEWGQCPAVMVPFVNNILGVEG